jgi:hypothetical protein
MTAAADLLDMLRGQGFGLARAGNRIAVTPASRLTAELRDRIRHHRAELLAALDVDTLDRPPDTSPLPADPAELQARLDALTAAPAWADHWGKRLKAARYADLDAVRRTIAMMFDLAAERHRAGDATGFRSWCRFALDHAAGRHWDAAARRPVLWPPDREIITADEGAATFADGEAIRQRAPRAGRWP